MSTSEKLMSFKFKCEECPKKFSIEIISNSSCTFKLDTYHLNVQNVTLHLQCHEITMGYNIMTCLGSKTKTRPRQDSLCLGKPRQNQDKTNSVLEKPRQNQDKTCLGFVLSWIQDRFFLSCLGLVLVLKIPSLSCLGLGTPMPLRNSSYCSFN